MRTIDISLANVNILKSMEVLSGQLQNLRAVTGTEIKFKSFLKDRVKSITSELLVIQDLLIYSDEIDEFALMDLIGDYVETIN